MPPTPVSSDLRPTNDWWKSAVVYQIYPRSFADSNGDGIGDLPGIISKLDYLAELGVDVVWMSPAYKSPQDDNGYDISDYQDMDPTFGALADMDELIAGLHERGIKLVMDLVVNHTSDEHPWFVESRSSRDNPKRDWYWWRDEPETEWESFFSGSVWEHDETTDSYYLHLFSRKQPDLNWENPQVREAVYEMMRWWLDRGVDGFRMDVINLISKKFNTDGSLDGTESSYVDGPRMHEFMQEMHREVLAGRNLITVGETPGVTIAEAQNYTDPARNEVNMVFTFEHMNLDTIPGQYKWGHRDLYLPDLKENLSAWQTGLMETGWNSLYWDNHDQPRAVSRFGNDGEHRVASAKTLATVLHMMRGTPYIYQGEEFGMTNSPFVSVDEYQDIESLNWAKQAAQEGWSTEEITFALSVKSRDHARTPVQWDATDKAGFTTGQPWLAVNPNYVEINAAAAVADPTSVFHHHRMLINLRHTHDVIVNGDYRLLLPEHEQVFAYARSLDGKQVLVLANFSDEHISVDLGEDAGLLDGQILLSTDGRTEARPNLNPWESIVVLNG
ncbi:alpha-glucosidase [Ornithinimicrobium sp. Arc0846-15]|nr:alpha-glucosidase [Ornithinimicrobium laminariae]